MSLVFLISVTGAAVRAYCRNWETGHGLRSSLSICHSVSWSPSASPVTSACCPSITMTLPCSQFHLVLVTSYCLGYCLDSWGSLFVLHPKLFLCLFQSTPHQESKADFPYDPNHTTLLLFGALKCLFYCHYSPCSLTVPVGCGFMIVHPSIFLAYQNR